MTYTYDMVPTQLNPDVSPEMEREASFFMKWGYLVIDNALNAAQMEILQCATDAVFSSGKSEFIHQLLEADERLEFLIDNPPVLARMKAILGNCLQLHSATGRITHPGAPDQNWHRDGPWPIDPQGTPYGNMPGQINCAYYLDELTMQNGPVVLVPGSHRAPFRPPVGCPSFPDEKFILAKPGQAILFDGWTYHRGRSQRFEWQQASLPDVLPKRMDALPRAIRWPCCEQNARRRLTGATNVARRSGSVVILKGYEACTCMLLRTIPPSA